MEGGLDEELPLNYKAAHIYTPLCLYFGSSSQKLHFDVPFFLVVSHPSTNPYALALFMCFILQ